MDRGGVGRGTSLRGVRRAPDETPKPVGPQTRERRTGSSRPLYVRDFVLVSYRTCPLWVFPFVSTGRLDPGVEPVRPKGSTGSRTEAGVTYSGVSRLSTADEAVFPDAERNSLDGNPPTPSFRVERSKRGSGGSPRGREPR